MHESVGVIDVSTLGKILVEGPDAGGAARPPLPEPLRRPPAGPDPLRRADHRRRPDHGRRDGRPARRRALLRHDDLDRLRRRLRVVRVVERRLGLRRRDRQRHRRARGRQRRRARGRARRSARLTDADVSNEAFRYLDAREIRVAGVPCLALRIGFVGELGYELHCAASRRRAPLGRVRRRRRAAVRARAAARASPREGARDRRPGHRLGVEPALCRDAVDRSSSTRTTSSASGLPSSCRSAACASGSSASRCRRRACRSRARRSSRRPPGGPRDERALERASRTGDRPRLGRAGPAPTRGRRSRSGSTARCTPRTVTLAPFYDPEGALLRS